MDCSVLGSAHLVAQRGFKLKHLKKFELFLPFKKNVRFFFLAPSLFDYKKLFDITGDVLVLFHKPLS